MEEDCTHKFNACWTIYARLMGEDDVDTQANPKIMDLLCT